MVKLHKPKEGEWVRFWPGLLNHTVCCDCGLVHAEEYAVKNFRGEPTVFQKAWRDELATSLIRSERRRKKRMVRKKRKK